MKKLLIVGLLAAAFSVSSFAQTSSTSSSSANPNATSAASNSGVTTGVTINQEASVIPTDTTTTIRNVPSMGAPSLTTSNDTCMGSSSGGIALAGFGLTGGSTKVEVNCKMLKNSRELWNMGMRGASIKLLCTDPDNRFALESTGVDCGETKEQWLQNGGKVAVIAPAPVVVPPVAKVEVVTPKVEVTDEATHIEQKAARIKAAKYAQNPQ